MIIEFETLIVIEPSGPNFCDEFQSQYLGLESSLEVAGCSPPCSMSRAAHAAADVKL